MAASREETPTSVEVPSLTLNDGVQMPILGFGTSGVRLRADPPAEEATQQRDQAQAQAQDQEAATYAAIRLALEVGYRFFDTAALYQNERVVGRALRDAMRAGLVRREHLFVCTKVWNTAHKRRSVERACRQSLERLGLDYVDLYLIHWPVAYEEDQPGEGQVNPRDPATGRLRYSQTHFLETWRGMEDVRFLGLARSIGLSNFNRQMIGQILAMDQLRYPPSVLQVELHPYLAQTKLADFCRAHRIALNAYCPLGAPGAAWLPQGEPRVIDDPLVAQLAAKYGKSPAQIILRYHIERGVAPIPKSDRPARMRENLRVFDFRLSEPELRQLLELDRNLRCCLNTAGEYVTDHPLYPFHEEA